MLAVIIYMVYGGNMYSFTRMKPEISEVRSSSIADIIYFVFWHILFQLQS
jgi:hypothetical protein